MQACCSYRKTSKGLSRRKLLQLVTATFLKEILATEDFPTEVPGVLADNSLGQGKNRRMELTSKLSPKCACDHKEDGARVNTEMQAEARNIDNVDAILAINRQWMSLYHHQVVDQPGVLAPPIPTKESPKPDKR